MESKTQQQLDDLLRANSMTPDTLHGPTLAQLFLSQMRISLYGGQASVPMLPTFLKPFGTLREGVPVAVAHVDDRQVRVCLVRMQDGQPQISQENAFAVPGREYPAPLGDILYAVAELIQPLLEQARFLALCLPFPIDYDGKGDGVIRRFPGSMTVSDFAGKPVLAALARELASRSLTPPPMVLVSQADAVLLAAGIQDPGRGRYLGLTWGSGLDERKLLSFGCSRDVLSLTWLGLDTLVEFLTDPEKGGTMAHFCREPEDREVGLAVGHAVLDRAARLVCANLAAVLTFIGGGRDPQSPVCIGLEGDAFQAPPLKAALEAQVETFLRQELGLHVTLCQGERMVAAGAAAALYTL